MHSRYLVYKNENLRSEFWKGIGTFIATHQTMPGENQVFVCRACKFAAPGLQSGKDWEDKDENLIFPQHLMRHDEGPSGISSFFDVQSELSSLRIPLDTDFDLLPHIIFAWKRLKLTCERVVLR